ncbi:hypothetical protein Dimus_012965, partial [Dionaea muscipula]
PGTTLEILYSSGEPLQIQHEDGANQNPACCQRGPRVDSSVSLLLLLNTGLNWSLWNYRSWSSHIWNLIIHIIKSLLIYCIIVLL